MLALAVTSFVMPQSGETTGVGLASTARRLASSSYIPGASRASLTTSVEYL
jgi:hypothetical protein